MSYFDFANEMTKIEIKQDKKSLRNCYGLFILNLSLCILNSINLYNGQSHWAYLTSIAIGVTGTGCMWIWLCIWEIISNIKFNKDKLLQIMKIKDLDVLNNEIEYYKNANKKYNDYFANNIKES